MKIYAIRQGYYETDIETFGLYATKEIAEEMLALSGVSADDARIEEWDVCDKVTEHIKVYYYFCTYTEGLGFMYQREEHTILPGFNGEVMFNDSVKVEEYPNQHGAICHVSGTDKDAVDAAFEEIKAKYEQQSCEQ